MSFDSPFVFSFTDFGGEGRVIVIPSVIMEYEYMSNYWDIDFEDESMCLYCDMACRFDSFNFDEITACVKDEDAIILELAHAIRGYFKKHTS